MNIKFRIGDRVKVVNSCLVIEGQKGTIVDITLRVSVAVKFPIQTIYFPFDCLKYLKVIELSEKDSLIQDLPV